MEWHRRANTELRGYISTLESWSNPMSCTYPVFHGRHLIVNKPWICLPFMMIWNAGFGTRDRIQVAVSHGYKSDDMRGVLTWWSEIVCILALTRWKALSWDVLSTPAHACVCMFECMFICIYMYMYAYMYVSTHLCMYQWNIACLNSISECVCVFAYLSLFGSLSVQLYAHPVLPLLISSSLVHGMVLVLNSNKAYISLPPPPPHWLIDWLVDWMHPRVAVLHTCTQT